MLRGDFHHHINTDPVDGNFVTHSAGELIDHAAAAGINVLAITCHQTVPYDNDVIRYAADRGIVLLRGMEANVGRQHVLLLNFEEFPPGRCSLADIAAAKTSGSLVIAPHPFYPTGVAGGEMFLAHPESFDAVEFSGLYTPLTSRFNRHAAEFARKVRAPVVGNSDTHFLWQLGYTYTLIDAPAEPAAIIEAIRCGRVQLVTRPLSWVQVANFIIDSHSGVMAFRDALQYLFKVLRRSRAAAVTPAAVARGLMSEEASAPRGR